MSSFFGGLPDAFESGINQSLDAGKKVFEEVGKFAEIEFISAGDLMKRAEMDAIRNCVKTGQGWNNLPLDNVAFVRRVGLNIPFDFDANTTGFDGHLWVGAENVSLSGVEKIGVSGALQTGRPVKIGAHTIQGIINFGMGYDPQTGEPTYQHGVQLESKF